MVHVRATQVDSRHKRNQLLTVRNTNMVYPFITLLLSLCTTVSSIFQCRLTSSPLWKKNFIIHFNMHHLKWALNQAPHTNSLRQLTQQSPFQSSTTPLLFYSGHETQWLVYRSLPAQNTSDQIAIFTTLRIFWAFDCWLIMAASFLLVFWVWINSCLSASQYQLSIPYCIFFQICHLPQGLTFHFITYVHFFLVTHHVH